MRQQALEVQAGGLFCFSEGEYSDFRYTGHFLAMEPLNRTVFESVVESVKSRIESGELRNHRGNTVDPSCMSSVNPILQEYFIPELIRTGKIISVDCVEIHTGSYGEFSLA
jgi:hypothetical protein